MLFTQTQQMLDIIEHHVAAAGMRYLRMDGSVPPPVRFRMIDAFNRHPPPGTPPCGSLPDSPRAADSDAAAAAAAQPPAAVVAAAAGAASGGSGEEEAFQDDDVMVCTDGVAATTDVRACANNKDDERNHEFLEDDDGIACDEATQVNPVPKQCHCAVIIDTFPYTPSL